MTGFSLRNLCCCCYATLTTNWPSVSAPTRLLTWEEEPGLSFERREHAPHGGGTLVGRLDDGGERVPDVGLQVGQVRLSPLALSQLAGVHLENGTANVSVLLSETAQPGRSEPNNENNQKTVGI